MEPGNQYFQGPMELSFPKSMIFFCCCSNMQCPSVKMTRRLWRLQDAADKNSLSGAKDKSRNLGKRSVKLPAQVLAKVRLESIHPQTPWHCFLHDPKNYRPEIQQHPYPYIATTLYPSPTENNSIHSKQDIYLEGGMVERVKGKDREDHRSLSHLFMAFQQKR